jgi:hydroxylamine dehydrogenase
MFLEYRMRTFKSAYHMHPDYIHWYGWTPIRETLQKIKGEAETLKTEKTPAAAH